MYIRTITFRADEQDAQALQQIRERFGLISDAAAIRFAIRLVFKMEAEDIIWPPVRSNMREVEK